MENTLNGVALCITHTACFFGGVAVGCLALVVATIWLTSRTEGYRSKLPNELRMYRDGVLVYNAPITLEPDYRPWCPHHEDEAECRLVDPVVAPRKGKGDG